MKNTSKSIEKKFLHFTSEIHLLLQNSFDFLTALKIFHKSTKDSQLKSATESAINKIQNGKSITEALFSNEFSILPIFYRTVFSTAEKSGTFNIALKNLELYMKKRADFENHIKRILVYPLMTISFAFLALFIILFYFMPSLNYIYHELKINLPLPTKFMLLLAPKISILLFPLVFAFFILAISFIKSPFKKISLLGKIKSLSPIVEWFNCYYLSFHFSLLTGAGIDFMQAIEILAKEKNFEKIENVLSDIKSGIAPSESFSKYISLPPIFYESIRIGIERGEINTTFKYLLQNSQNKLENTTAFFQAFLEPLLIISTALFVGIIIFFCLYPILTLSDFSPIY